MSARFYTFVQLELPWQLGPADGRYLLRKADGPDGGKPEQVIVLGTVGAERRGLLGRRSRVRRTDPRPTPVSVTRATVVDALPLANEQQADSWLSQLDPEREAASAVGALNRMLYAQRIAAAAPYLHELSASQALVIRAGYGEGEQVADGVWREARELQLSQRRTGRRAAVLRPQERLATLLSGSGRALICEELALRSRHDLDAGRLELCAIELERAYQAALSELTDERREDLSERLAELERLRPDVRAAAAGVLERPMRTPEKQALRHPLERLEAALRARTAPGFSVKR